jgi:hypothetical protein
MMRLDLWVMLSVHTITQCSDLDYEIHRAASKLSILGFEPLRQSTIADTFPIARLCRGFRIPRGQTWPREGTSIRTDSWLPSNA